MRIPGREDNMKFDFVRPEGTSWVVGLGRNLRIICWAQ